MVDKDYIIEADRSYFKNWNSPGAQGKRIHTDTVRTRVTKVRDERSKILCGFRGINGYLENLGSPALSVSLSSFTWQYNEKALSLTQDSSPDILSSKTVRSPHLLSNPVDGGLG